MTEIIIDEKIRIKIDNSKETIRKLINNEIKFEKARKLSETKNINNCFVFIGLT